MKWYQRILSTFKKPKRWSIVNVNEVPESIEKNIIYRVHNDGFCWQMMMKCPCGCKTLLHLNTLQEFKPYWRLTMNDKGAYSVHPSINRKEGCRSHFFIKNSYVLWV